MGELFRIGKVAKGVWRAKTRCRNDDFGRRRNRGRDGQREDVFVIFFKLLLVVLLCLAGWWVTHRAIPWAVVRIGRLAGFRMQMTPLTLRRVRRFKQIRRGYFCFVILTTAFVLSMFLELYVNHRPLYISYEAPVVDGEQAKVQRQFPAVVSWLQLWLPRAAVERLGLSADARQQDFGLRGDGAVPYHDYARWVRDPEELEQDALRIEAWIEKDEDRFHTMMEEFARQQDAEYDRSDPLPDDKIAEYEEKRAEAAFLRRLKDDFEAGRARIVMPLWPYSHQQQLLHLPGQPPHKPFVRDVGQADDPTANPATIPILGTDYEGNEILAQLLYGFRISFTFAISVAFIGYFIGVSIGAMMGYFGGWFDIIVQRIIEVWGSIPFLFVIIIIASIMQPSFWVLAVLLVVLQAWISITFFMRGEFYREKARDYVQAAAAMGVGDAKIIGRHILPNALVPVVTYMPFAIVAYINTLVALDYLGFGLPPESPSWGRLLRQGAENIINHPHLVGFAVVVMAATLFCVVLIGEAVREAFDPRKYSRLR